MMTRDGSVNDQWLLCSCFLSKNIRLPFEFIMIAGSFSSFTQKLWKFDFKIYENFWFEICCERVEMNSATDDQLE